MKDAILKPLRWLKHKIKHKMEHYSLAHFKELFRRHGLALLVIFIIWEIVEDILFPALFIWLGHNVNPWFLTGAPVAWLLCLHPFAVPIIWAIWIRISPKKLDD